MIIIPNRTSKKINQNNRSKILGDLWASFNLDLQSNLGVFKVSPRLMVNTAGVTNQGLSTAFSIFNSKIFSLCDTRIFSAASVDLTVSFTEDAETGAITTYDKNVSDMITFNETICATAQTKLMSLDTGGTWTQRATLNTASAHKLCWFVKFNRLYYLNNFTTIRSIDTSWSEATSGDYFLDLTPDYNLNIPYTMDADSSDIWIGMMQASTNSDTSTGSHILRWDGISSQITADYKIKARGVLALCKDDRNIMHAIDTNGALLQFTGSGFEEIARLPLNRSLLSGATSFYYNGFVHPNGLQFSRNGTFIVNVNNLIGDSAGSIKENLPSGIWEYSKDTGFVHRQSYSYTPINTTTITDYGQNRVSQVGALTEVDLPSNSANGKPTLICGATYYTDASTTKNGIFVDDPLDTTQKYGNFVTSWLLSSNLKDNWNKIALKYRKLLNSADRIWLKYRLSEVSPTEISITWSGLSPNQSIFTTTTDLTAMIGYEVEVIQGTGSGKCAHIISAVNNAGTYTVTLDEPFTGSTGTAKARIQAWVKTLIIDNQTFESIIKSIASATSERVQLKCCMQFTGEGELYEVILINSVNTSLV